MKKNMVLLKYLNLIIVDAFTYIFYRMGIEMDNGITKEVDQKKVKDILHAENSHTQRIDRESIHEMLDPKGEDTQKSINRYQNELETGQNANLEKQLEESIQKLVENEVNVARASLYTQKHRYDEETVKGQESRINSFVQGNPASKDDVSKYKKVQSDRHDTNEKKSNNTFLVFVKKNLYLIIGIIILAIICIIVAVTNYNKKHSYRYMYESAQNYEKNGQYEEAISYYEKALILHNDNQNTILYDLYDCYQAVGNQVETKNILTEIIRSSINTEKAYMALSEIYQRESDGEAINKLIADCHDNVIKDKLRKYQPDKPMASQSSGVYYNELSIDLSVISDNDIYYTLDGNRPSKDSSLYEDKIILTEGKTVLSAIAVNDIGVYSDVAEWQYELEKHAPDMPQILLESGTYSYGQTVDVQKADDADNIYYTLDDSTPTTEDALYTDSVLLPEGNIIFSIVEFNQYGLASSVVKRNFIIEPEKVYTFEEAKGILQAKMQQNGLLRMDGMTQDGGSVNYIYQAKQTIDAVEVYNIRFDIKKDGHTYTAGYYGVGVKNGECYQISGINGSVTLEGY